VTKELIRPVYPYTFCIIPDGDGYTGYVAECNGCITCGDTVEEVWLHLQDALEGWLRAVKKLNRQAPQPREKIIFDDEWGRN